jgi:DNA repair protein RadD
MAPLVPRDEQRAAIAALFSAWDAGENNALVVMTVATGKALVITELVKEILARQPDTRILVVADVQEIVRQDYEHLIRQWPSAPVGMNAAALGRRDLDQQIIVAQVQSVRRAAHKLGDRQVVIVDEVHRVPRYRDSMFRQVFRAVGAKRIAGFTATDYRLDSGRLTEGNGALFDRVVYEFGYGDALKASRVVPLRSKNTKAQIDTMGVHIKQGDFAAAELEAVANEAGLVKRTVTEIIARCTGRRTILVFCCGVDHALHVRDVLRERGETAETITGGTSQDERERIIRQFESGEIRFVTNVGVLTTGSNIPPIDAIAFLRATLSTGLYVQCIGRGARLSPETGKKDCLFLDFGGNIRRHGPIDAVNPKRDSSSLKDCPECDEVVRASTEKCPACGYTWKRKEREAAAPVRRTSSHDWQPDQAPVMSNEWVDVTCTQHFFHRKQSDPDAPPSLRVEYRCGLLQWHKEWVCFEHRGFPRQKAEDWWRANGGPQLAPGSVVDALSRIAELDHVVAIKVKRDGQWWRVYERKIRRSDGSVVEIDENYIEYAEGEREAELAALRHAPLAELMADSSPF